MPGARDDYLLRLVAQAAEAVRRLRERLLGGAPSSELLSGIRAAEGELLGGRASLLRALDARSAAQLLGDRQEAAAWATLLRLEAEVRRRDGDEAGARNAESKAAALEQQARP